VEQPSRETEYFSPLQQDLAPLPFKRGLIFPFFRDISQRVFFRAVLPPRVFFLSLIHNLGIFLSEFSLFSLHDFISVSWF